MKRRCLIVLGLSGALLVGVAYAVAHVGISIQITVGRASPVSQLARISVSAPGPRPSVFPMFPGASGDVPIRITNANPRKVIVTGLMLPSREDFAAGFTSPSMVKARVGCNSATSGVTWEDAAPTRGSSAPLEWPLVVGPRSSLVVTRNGCRFHGTHCASEL